MTIIGLFVVVTLAILTPAAIAAKCRGEASFAVSQCACTVRNRLDAGWSEYRVLDAYHAPSVQASPEQVQLVADVMSGAISCDPGLYFMYGAGDVQALKLEQFEPALIVRSGDKEVRFYQRRFRRSKP